jgi:hypothetical protein
MADKGRIFTGARARFSINGVKIGYARNVNVSESINYEAVEVLDNIEVEEYAPVSYTVTMTCSMFRIIGETLKSMGLFPSNGSNTSDHLSNILVQGDLVATIEDSKTGKIFSTLEGVKIQSHNWTVDARGIVGEDCSFVIIRCRDESEV